MAFDNNDFVKLLNFYKEDNNFPDNAKKSFDKVSEVSKSDDIFKNSLIMDDNYIFDLDNMCWNSHLKNDKKEFLSWLLKVPKRLYVVFLNDEHDSRRNESKSYKYLRMDKKLEKRYAPFKELANMENSIVTQDEFLDGFIGKFFN